MKKHSLSQHFMATVRSQSAAAKWAIVYSTGRVRSVPFLHLAELCIQIYAEKLQKFIGSVLTGVFRLMSKWERRFKRIHPFGLLCSACSFSMFYWRLCRTSTPPQPCASRGVQDILDLAKLQATASRRCEQCPGMGILGFTVLWGVTATGTVHFFHCKTQVGIHNIYIPVHFFSFPFCKLQVQQLKAGFGSVRPYVAAACQVVCVHTCIHLLCLKRFKNQECRQLLWTPVFRFSWNWGSRKAWARLLDDVRWATNKTSMYCLCKGVILHHFREREMLGRERSRK
jgi:hypothetical protein